MTAGEVKGALYRHFTRAGWAVSFEVSRGDVRSWRVIDALAIRAARRPGIGSLQYLALEVKVSRGDFLADVADPGKQEPWRDFAHQHAFVAPAGLVAAGEVPAGSGLLEVDQEGKVRWVVRAPFTGSCDPAPWWLLRTLAYREARARARLAGMTTT